MPLICIDCRYIGPRPSGIAKVVQALVNHAPSLAPDLDFLLLKHPRATDRLTTAENVREVVVKAAANSPTTMWWLPFAVDLSQVDLFHATFNIMPAGLRMPCVTTVHDIMWLTNPEWCNARYSSAIERPFYQHGINRALRRSAAIATVSEASKREICEFASLAADRVKVTPLGVAKECRKVAVDPRRLARLGLPPERRFVLTVGQHVPYKNHEGAVEIFAEAAASLSDVDLVFVQRINRQPDELKQLAEQLGVGKRLHFLPSVDQDDLTMLYSAATALLHPSFCEGFGLPLAEAMACGCPVVTSDVSAMAEVVGDAGLMANPHDPSGMASALRTVLTVPGVRAALQDKGPQRAAAMNWERFAAGNVELYREAMQ